ncbi:MAG: non-homologous end-joining DNA ligase [Acidimicrobiales bacterium]
MPSAQEVEIEGRRLGLSNLDKVLYPSGFTKAAVIDYYVRVGPILLTHLSGRPLTLKRYPNGSAGPFFYEKNCPSHRPDWVQTIEVPSRRKSEKTINYCTADDLATLVWLANLAALELHPLLARGAELDQPTAVVFDLDPGPPAAMTECARVALEIRELLGPMGMQAFPKTSGSKGLQLYVPLNTPTTYEATKAFAHRVAVNLEKKLLGLVVEKMDKARRQGKVLIDWSQNHPTKTTVGAYSLRAMDRPTVSTPVSWDEVELAAGGGQLSFEAADVIARVGELGDLFAPVADLKQVLPE